jgi:hypothetical protein
MGTAGSVDLDQIERTRYRFLQAIREAYPASLFPNNAGLAEKRAAFTAPLMNATDRDALAFTSSPAFVPSGGLRSPKNSGSQNGSPDNTNARGMTICSSAHREDGER